MEKKNKKYFYNPLKTRTIICSSAIDDEVADRILKELLMLEQESNKPIRLIINSPGGQVSSGMAIYDFMQLIQSPVHTIVVGLAASMGSILLIGGASGCCSITVRSRVMIHQPLMQNVVAKASDLVITAEEIEKTKKLIATLYQKKTGKNLQKILKDIDQDHWFSAEEAVNYGLADNIITKFQF